MAYNQYLFDVLIVNVQFQSVNIYSSKNYVQVYTKSFSECILQLLENLRSWHEYPHTRTAWGDQWLSEVC